MTQTLRFKSSDQAKPPTEERPGSRKILAFPETPVGEETPRPTGPTRASSGGPIWLRIDVFHLK